MATPNFEDGVKACYSTWGTTYYDDYYGPKAAYPPVHRDLLVRLLLDSGASNVLDAGCGPASFLRDLAHTRLDRYGFDLTPEMVSEARQVLSDQGVPQDHIWEGSVLASEAFRSPTGQPSRFEAAVCVGVLPHVPAEHDVRVMQNLREAVKPGGLVVLEARNQLFALFTFNRYSHQFFAEELIRVAKMQGRAGDQATVLESALDDLQRQFRMDHPPVRKGTVGEPGYDEVLSRTHNPLVVKEQLTAVGFTDVRVLFYHYHCLPPMLAAAVPELFRRESLAMENPEDWRGYFMASAFLVAGRRA